MFFPLPLLMFTASKRPSTSWTRPPIGDLLPSAPSKRASATQPSTQRHQLTNAFEATLCSTPLWHTDRSLPNMLHRTVHPLQPRNPTTPTLFLALFANLVASTSPLHPRRHLLAPPRSAFRAKSAPCARSLTLRPHVEMHLLAALMRPLATSDFETASTLPRLAQTPAAHHPNSTPTLPPSEAASRNSHRASCIRDA